MSNEIIPYFTRGEKIPPPGNVKRYGLLNSDESFSLLEHATENGLLTSGQCGLVMGLFLLGGVKKFPGGDGLLYDDVFKKNFEPDLALNACKEIAKEIETYTDVILAPEHSSIIPATIISLFLNVPIVKINKNGVVDDSFMAQLDSYTGGERDTLSIGKNRVSQLFKRKRTNPGGTLRATVFDDILDTGAMSLAMADIVKQMQKAGHPIKLSGIAALFEKGYTKVRNRLSLELNIVPVSSLFIEDLGMLPKQWIKIRGVEKALSFE